MAFVLDASITLCWCFEDEVEPVVDRAASLLASGQALVPSLWWFEIRNALATGLRRNRASQTKIDTFLADLSKLKIEIDKIPDDRGIFDLARRHRLTFYDAAYLDLAKRERLPLASLDRALNDAATAEGVALVVA